MPLWECDWLEIDDFGDLRLTVDDAVGGKGFYLEVSEVKELIAVLSKFVEGK